MSEIDWREEMRGLCHDLRSPLNIVLGFGQLLRPDVPAEQREDLDRIVAAAEEMLDRLDQVRDLGASVGAASPPARGAPGAAGTSVGDARPVVLLVEDHPANVRLVERVLEHRPTVRLEVVGDTVAAGERLASGPAPMLVLLDRNLPGRSGPEALRTWRADGVTAPVIVVTADATQAAAEEAAAAGADGVITKPFSVGEVLAAVDAYASSSESLGSNR